MENTILAVDAALGPASVAVMRGTALLAEAREERPQMQAAQLVPMIEAAMKQAGLAYSGLDSILCTVGPGTFTGLRIGLAAAKGIGFASGKPVHGISTLVAAAMAAKAVAPDTQHVLVALNAGKGEAYCQLFHVEQKIYFDKSIEPVIASSEALRGMAVKDVLIAGNIPPEWTEGRRFLPLLPDARAAGLAAFASPALLLPPEPLYIRPPDAKPAQLIAH